MEICSQIDKKCPAHAESTKQLRTAVCDKLGQGEKGNCLNKGSRQAQEPLATWDGE